jgi:hypothetical protein
VNADNISPQLERPAVRDQRCRANGVIVIELLGFDEGHGIAVLVQNEDLVVRHDTPPTLMRMRPKSYRLGSPLNEKLLSSPIVSDRRLPNEHPLPLWI